MIPHPIENVVRLAGWKERKRMSALLPRILIALILVLLSRGPSAFADSIEVGEFIATTGTAPYTQSISHGLGETPKAILVWTNRGTNVGFITTFYFLLGMSDGTTEACVMGAAANGNSTSRSRTRVASKLISLILTTGAQQGEAELQSWNSTTFTLNWTIAAPSTIRFQYMLIGGSGISADVTTWTSPTSTGDRAVTGVGFAPDAVIHSYSAGVTTLDTTINDLNLGFGVMDGTGDEWALGVYSEDGLSTSNSISGQQSDAAIHDPDGASALREASFVSMDTDGFTVNFSQVDTANYNASLSLKGVTAEALTFSKSTGSAPDSQEVNGHAFEPSAVILASFQEPSAAGAVDDAKIGFGAGTSTDEVSTALFHLDNVATSDCDRYASTTKVFTVMDNASQSIDAIADLTSLDDDGFTLNWTTNNATAVQMCSFALAPFSAIAVRVSRARALADSAGVCLSWKTERENNNLGFHVLRERGGARTRISRTLVLGSALSAGGGTTVEAGQRYSFLDPSGEVGDRYWIEDIDLDGSRRTHGPVTSIALASQLSQHSAAALHSTAALTTGFRPPLGSQPTPPMQSSSSALTGNTFQPLRLSYDSRESQDAAFEAWLAGMPALIMGVASEGIYRVTQAEWLAAGLSRQVNHRNLALYLRGAPQSFEAKGLADGTFDPSDSVIFYGRGDRGNDDAHSYYWLVEGNEPGRRMAQAATPTISATSSPTYRETWAYAPRLNFFPALRNGEKGNYFADLVSDVPTSIPISLPALAPIDPLSPALWTVRLQGIGATDHEVTVASDGQLIGTLSFSGQENRVAHFPASVIGNELSLQTASSNDFVFIDSITIEAPRSFAFEGPVWVGTIPGGGVAVLDDLPAGARVFDVTDPTAVSLLPASPLQHAAGPGHLVSVPLGGARRVLATAEFKTPDRIRGNRPSRWREQGQGFEFLVIAPEALHPALRPLAQARQAEGLTTAIVAYEDLCDEFSGGARTPGAIRAFLEVGQRNWNTPPRYVLLVGEATTDPLEYLSRAPENLLPTARLDSAQIETASDAWYGDVLGDARLEIAIGRFPVSTIQEVESLVQRTLNYGTLSPNTYRTHSIAVLDDDDSFSFSTARPSLLARASSLSWRFLDRNQHSLAQVSEDLESSLRQGVGSVAYFGHGGRMEWGAESLWDAQRASGLELSDRVPIVAMASCLNGYFHSAEQECLAEAWLEAEGGGAAAVLASTTLANPYAQRDLTIEWLGILADTPAKRLGDALLEAQHVVDANTVRATVLLGDPTLRFER